MSVLLNRRARNSHPWNLIRTPRLQCRRSRYQQYTPSRHQAVQPDKPTAHPAPPRTRAVLSCHRRYPDAPSRPTPNGPIFNSSRQSFKLRSAIVSPAGLPFGHQACPYGLDLAGNRPKSITSGRNTKMKTKHRWRPASVLHAVRWLGACSHKTMECGARKSRISAIA